MTASYSARKVGVVSPQSSATGLRRTCRNSHEQASYDDNSSRSATPVCLALQGSLSTMPPGQQMQMQAMLLSSSELFPFQREPWKSRSLTAPSTLWKKGI
jgi:hypothetical protein